MGQGDTLYYFNAVIKSGVVLQDLVFFFSLFKVIEESRCIGKRQGKKGVTVKSVGQCEAEFCFQIHEYSFLLRVFECGFRCVLLFKFILLKLSLTRSCQQRQMPEVLMLFHRHLKLGYKA